MLDEKREAEQRNFEADTDFDYDAFYQWLLEDASARVEEATGALPSWWWRLPLERKEP